METIEVAVPGHAYPVLVGAGAVRELPDLLPAGVSASPVITDRNAGPHWAGPLVGALARAGVAAPVLTLPAGERTKSWSALRRVVAFLEDHRVDRSGFVVALGGGVIGDLTGLAAAVWLRGIAHVQVPTTLLAMVDSSVGGKTAIDTGRTKNSVGAFWQPAAVVVDLDHLGTLPERHYLAAFAEVVKYAMTIDGDLLAIIEARSGELRRRAPQALETVVARSVGAKARIVVADEREAGEREILNYGHTVGHALEVASGYRMVHGQAVAAGMQAAAWISVQAGTCSERLAREQARALAAFGLPRRLPALAPEAVLEAIRRDKKAKGGNPKWVLLTAMGQARTGCEVPWELISRAVRGLLEGTL